MLTLRIKSKGQMVQLPGVAPFRTPATMDVSKMKVRNLIGYLTASGIEDYEIVATSDKGVVEVYKKADFDLLKKKEDDPNIGYKKNIDKRFNKLEKLIGKLISKQDSQKTTNKEQTIDDKLNRIERLLEESSVRQVVYTKTEGEKDVKIEELEDAFIPEVDVSDMKMSSSGAKILEQDSDDIEGSANLLSGLTKKGAKK